MRHPRPAYAGIAILLSMLIAIAIGLYLLVMPVKSQSGTQQGGAQGQQGAGTTSYLGQIQRGQQRGNRLATATQCRAVAQSITVVELSQGMTTRFDDTFALLDALRADGQYAQLPFDSWNANTPADPPIVYVPERRRGTSGVLFYEHPQNHDGAGGHVAYDSGGVEWLDWEAFKLLTDQLPQPTW